MFSPVPFFTYSNTFQFSVFSIACLLPVFIHFPCMYLSLLYLISFFLFILITLFHIFIFLSWFRSPFVSRLVPRLSLPYFGIVSSFFGLPVFLLLTLCRDRHWSIRPSVLPCGSSRSSTSPFLTMMNLVLVFCTQLHNSLHYKNISHLQNSTPLGEQNALQIIEIDKHRSFHYIKCMK